MPVRDRASPIQPSALGHPPASAASGRIVKIGLRARIGPTIEMSPRALARASRPLIPITSRDEAAMAGQAAPGGTNAWPETTKKTTHAAQATAWVHATITSGGISRARPLTTANCTAWVSAAPSDSANQVRRGPRSRPAERSSILCLRPRP